MTAPAAAGIDLTRILETYIYQKERGNARGLLGNQKTISAVADVVIGSDESSATFCNTKNTPKILLTLPIAYATVGLTLAGICSP